MFGMNRWRTSIAILAVGTVGVFAIGCGDSDSNNDSTSNKINDAIDQAQEKINDADVNGKIDEAQKKSQDKLDEAQKQIDEAQNNGDIPSQDQIDKAQKQVQDALDKVGQ